MSGVVPVCRLCCCYPAVPSLPQESQVSVEVAIPQRYHRAIMGPKGCRIQHITREHEVQIKFPERDDSTAGQRDNTEEKCTCSCNTVLVK